MRDDDRYEHWKRRRAETSVPADFADRVLAAAREHGRARRWWLALQGLFLAVVSSRLSKVGVCTLALLACVFRMISVLALFVPG
jgi:hypothetical protein